MGQLFPLGIDAVGRRNELLVAWAWAINGFLSVFSSVFCIVLSMFIGFTSMLGVAAAVYAVGFLVMRSGGKSSGAPGPA